MHKIRPERLDVPDLWNGIRAVTRRKGQGMMQFERKGYGRIFVEKPDDVEKIKAIMREIDEDEYKDYFVDGIVTVFSEDDYKAVYTHKFDEMDLTEVMKRAWLNGIKCFCVLGKITGYESW